MTDRATSTDAEDIAKLLIHYSFDLDGYPPEQLIHHWATRYPMTWIRLAVVEALYQGRYKVISVEQILMIWQRRQKPLFHFNGEFERIVSSHLSESPHHTPTSSSKSVEPANVTIAYESAESSPAVSAAIATPQDYSAPALVDSYTVPPLPRKMGSRQLKSPASANAHTQTLSHPVPESGPTQWSVQYPLQTPSIAQFVPTGRASGFYSRLKSVVRQHEFSSSHLPDADPSQTEERETSSDLDLLDKSRY